MVDVVEEKFGDLVGAGVVCGRTGGANHREAVGKIASLLNLDEGDEVLGAQEGDEQVAAGGGGELGDVAHLEDAGDVDAGRDLLARGVDDGEFGDGRKVWRAEAGEQVGDIDAAAIVREGEVLRKATGGESPGFKAGAEVDEGDVVAEGVGDVENGSGAVGNEACGCPTGGDASLESEGLRVELLDGIG
jgi:hypothetical protein